MNTTKRRGLLLAGYAVHLAGLLLPFAGFKCDTPQPFFSLECAIPGWAYLLFWMFNPSHGHVLLAILEYVWVLALLMGLPLAVGGRFRRAGLIGSLLLLPSFVAVVAVLAPTRWLGPTCAGIGALLVLCGAVVLLRRGVEPGSSRRDGRTPSAVDETGTPGGA